MAEAEADCRVVGIASSFSFGARRSAGRKHHKTYCTFEQLINTLTTHLHTHPTARAKPSYARARQGRTMLKH